MADPPRTGLILVGEGEECRKQFEDLSPEDKKAFLEALVRQRIERDFHPEEEGTEGGYARLIEEYGRADVEQTLREKPWLYRNVETTALARRATANSKERPEVLKRVRQILTSIHRGTLHYTEDFLYESTAEYDSGNISTRVIGYRGPKSLKGIGAKLGGLFETDLYPEALPRTRRTEFQFYDFPSRESPSGRRLLSMIFHLESYGTGNIQWHGSNRTLAYFTDDTPQTRMEGESLEGALSKMLEIDHIASPLIIQEIAALPRNIEQYFKEKEEQYRAYIATLRGE